MRDLPEPRAAYSSDASRASFERAALELAEQALEFPPHDRGAWLDSNGAASGILRQRVDAIIRASDACIAKFGQTPDWGLTRGCTWTHPMITGRTAQVEATRLSAGDVIGEYRINRFIAAGGMGEVYEADHLTLPRRVAIKVLAVSASPSHSQRFRLEADLMARLEHPGLARLYAWDEAVLHGSTVSFIAMEYIDGSPITHAAARLSSTRERTELCLQVCDAIEYAHSRGIIHRDLKPGNILVDSAGRARILDFGVGRLLERESIVPRSLTAEGLCPGTPAYMSPEQLTGRARDVSTRSDIYSLGLLIHEVLSGKVAFEVSGVPLDETLRRLLNTDPVPIGRLVPDCRGDLEAIVRCATRKDPMARYPSVAALANDLSRHLRGEPIQARTLSVLEHIAVFARRRRVLATSTATAIIALGAGLAVAVSQYQRAVHAERVSQANLAEARDLAKTLLFDLGDALSKSPASASVRAMLADRAVRSLAALSRDTQDPARLAELSEGCTKLAMALGVPGSDHIGQFEQSRPLLDAALSLAERACLLDPSDPIPWMALGAARFGRALSESDKGSLPWLRSSVDAYNRVLTLCSGRLDSPAGAAAAERVAYISITLGYVTVDSNEATAAFETSDALYRQLIEQYPDQTAHVQCRATLLRTRGAVIAAMDSSAARTMLREAISLLDQLLAQEPNDFSSVRNRTIALVDLARVPFTAGTYDDPVGITDDACIAIAAWAAKYPDNNRIREDLIDSYLWRARIRIECIDRAQLDRATELRLTEEALELLNEGTRMQQRVSQSSPRDVARAERFAVLVTGARERLRGLEVDFPLPGSKPARRGAMSD